VTFGPFTETRVDSTMADTKAPDMPSAHVLKSLPPAALAGLVCEAAAGGDIERMRSLAKEGISVDVGTPYDRRTPLHLAAASGNLTMVKFLVEECGATLQQDRFGLLPIHDAVQNGHAEVRRYLQGRKLQSSEEIPADRPRALSCETAPLPAGRQQSLEDVMNTVFELVVKEGVFSYTTVHAEVQHFFKGLNFHPVYFEHFTPLQIAKHVHCLIAAKRVARATDDTNRMDFTFTTDLSAFFLTNMSCPVPTEAQTRTEEKVAKYLDQNSQGKNSLSLTFMASDGPAFVGGSERMGIYSVEQGRFDATRISEGETSIEVLASAKFLKEKTQVAKEQYQIIMEDVVATGRGVVRIVPGSVYPGPYPGGYVLLFGTAEAGGSCFFREMCAAMRLEGLSPKRFYLETFANGVLTYSIFFPHAKEAEVQRLKRTIMYGTLLKAYPGKSERIYTCVMQAKITHQVGLYLLSGVKFAYAFFPKEQYAPEYTTVHKVLEQDPASQRKLEALYKLCMKELLSTERIYELVQRHLQLGVQLFEDFRRIATGEAEPKVNEELGKAIDAACAEPQDRQILRMFLTFNASILLTNFFKAETPSAFAFRLNPAVVLKDRPASLYPATPYAIYLIIGRDFIGFHVRFRDVARGGIRLVLSRDQETYERNQSTLFDECYNLSLTQQYKNKDIPEGGAKGVILPDSSWQASWRRGNLLSGLSSQSPAAQRSCFVRYLNALLDCMLPAHSGIYTGHMQGREELLFFGPDENTAGFMDLGAELARVRGYPYWKALTTGKSVKLGGVPHDTYGMTTASVHTYVTELLRELGEDESAITKFQTGGPDGDLGSNEILVSKDKTIAIVDGSGVLYDPAGLDRAELIRLARRRVPVKEFSRSFLGKDGFLVTMDETDVTLPDGSTWRTGAELRDKFHLTSYATADLFVPCGGRPNSVSGENVKSLFVGDRPKFRMIVEGANLFFTDGARSVLERAGVHVFKDASTNKGGVTSSSLEVFAALALSVEDHSSLMTYSPEKGGAPPNFYQTYVQQILETIVENAKQEFKAIWACNRTEGVPKAEATRRLSGKINQMQDSIQVNFAAAMSEEERDQLVRTVLAKAVPPLIIQHIGVDGVLSRVPSNYVGAIVGAWVASHFVYLHGMNASEVAFFCFMRSLLTESDNAGTAALPAGGDASSMRDLKRRASDALEANKAAKTANGA